MTTRQWRWIPVAAAALAAGAAAQTTQTPASGAGTSPAHDANSARTQAAPAAQLAAPQHAPGAAPAAHVESEFHYREISDFFNIREAYANVDKGEWEFETWLEWETQSGQRDTYGPAASLKYGITDTFYAELELLPLTLGQGGDQGNGDIALQLFKELWKEGDAYPAMGLWGEMRIPSGQGSSGVDVELAGALTKTVAPHLRVHFNGFLMSANGSRGGDDDERRPFQWGAGPGVDYSFSDDTIATVNYLNRCSEDEGEPNENVIEFGLAQRLAPNQHLKLAVDVGVDGHESTPNLGAKVLWSIDW